MFRTKVTLRLLLYDFLLNSARTRIEKKIIVGNWGIDLILKQSIGYFDFELKNVSKCLSPEVANDFPNM